MTADSSELIVVGGGLAGLVTANRAAQLGLKVTVLEQGSAEKYLCNTRYTGGTFHLCLREITLEPAFLHKLIRETTDGFVKDDLAQLLAQGGAKIIQWLQGEGIKFMRASASEYHKWVLAPPGRSRPGLDWEGRGGDVLLRTLEANLVKRGGTLIRGAKAQSLIVENGQCVGVVAQHQGSNREWRGRAVVIADGGFQCNPDLLGRYVTKAPASLKQRNGGTAFGDGLRMAQALGAAITGTDRFYGHVLSRDALTNDNLWPYPYLDALVTAGIVVNRAGRRYTDEGRGGVAVANAVAGLDDPLSSTCVFDSAIWEGPGKNGLIAANPHLAREGATMFEAGDLDALATKAGVDAAGLKQTVADYNAALAVVGAAETFTPAGGVARRAKKYKPMPLVKPPFYAVPMVSGITYTMGGIVINVHAQALREDGSAIAGLYAVGAATGGLEGGPVIGYVGGLAKGGITGLAAAEHVAAAMERVS
jgi:fumarate reductase flavoprotein subunit